MPSGAVREIFRLLSEVCPIAMESVTRFIGVEMPATTMEELIVLRSGIGMMVLLLKRSAAAAEPLGKLKGMINVPLVAVLTTRSKLMLVPQTNPGLVLN